MQPPWKVGATLDPPAFAELRRAAVFDCCKWDPQVEDVATLAPFPLILRAESWRELAALAEQLALETLAAERELLERTDLHRRLGLSRQLCAVLRHLVRHGPRAPGVRVMRFDFHLTPDGWRISEANTDVPGGYNEATGFTALMARHGSEAERCGDPAGALADAMRDCVGPGATVALVHATGFADDRQVMRFLGRQLEARGLRPVLLAPDHLRWPGGQAAIETDWCRARADFVLRFFPAEWLPNLPGGCGWTGFFGNGSTPLCNPATALLTQSKRWVLAWPELETPLPVWRERLPETREPKAVPWASNGDWVVKPALGRVGEGIGLPGTTPASEWREIRRSVRWDRGHWIAQRRFEALPVDTPEGPRFVCLGVYTVDGRAAGVYGRISAQPLINHRAADLAVLREPCPARPRGRETKAGGTP